MKDGRQVTMMLMLARGTMELAVWRWTSGRQTAWPPPILLTHVILWEHTGVREQSVATTGPMRDMMASVIRMDVTSTLGDLEIL